LWKKKTCVPQITGLEPAIAIATMSTEFWLREGLVKALEIDGLLEAGLTTLK